MFSNVTLGTFSQTFLSSAKSLTTPQLLGVAFCIIAFSLYWARFVNDLPTSLGD